MIEDDDKGPKKSIMLNFSHVYKVNFSDRNTEAIKKLSDEFGQLPEFKNGDRNNKGKGFINFDNDFDIEFIMNPPYDAEDQEHNLRYQRPISIKNDNILCKRFRYEEYYEGRTEPQYREADIFWIKPSDILLIKGSEKACQKISKYLGRLTNAGFDQIKFNHHFLLWMSYKYEKYDGKLSNDLKFEKMDKSRTQGVNTNENDIRVKEGQGKMIPIPTLYGLLNEQKLSHVGGDFELEENFKINAKLATELSFFVYSYHDLSGKTYSEKCGYAFPFMIEILDIFDKWEKRQRNDDKCPDDNFFDSAIESFKTQIEYSIESIEELKEEYRNLRNGEGVEDAP